MSTLHPEPPHLSVYVLPGVPQDVAMVQCWQALEGAGCTFSSEVVVTRTRLPFRSVTEVDREVVGYDGTAARLLREHRVLAIGFRHPRFGSVSLSVAPTVDGDERHPLEVAVHAGGLSFPVALRSRDLKADARRRWSWAERLLVSMSEQTEADYGAVGVEVSFPSVRALGDSVGQRVLRPSTWVVPTSSNPDDRDEEESLLGALPLSSVVSVSAGTLVRGPGAHGENGVSDEDVDRVLTFLADRLIHGAQVDGATPESSYQALTTAFPIVGPG